MGSYSKNTMNKDNVVIMQARVRALSALRYPWELSPDSSHFSCRKECTYVTVTACQHNAHVHVLQRFFFASYLMIYYSKLRKCTSN
jgi:hypothetical protein